MRALMAYHPFLVEAWHPKCPSKRNRIWWAWRDSQICARNLFIHLLDWMDAVLCWYAILTNWFLVFTRYAWGNNGAQWWCITIIIAKSCTFLKNILLEIKLSRKRCCTIEDARTYGRIMWQVSMLIIPFVDCFGISLFKIKYRFWIWVYLKLMFTRQLSIDPSPTSGYANIFSIFCSCRWS